MKMIETGAMMMSQNYRCFLLAALIPSFFAPSDQTKLTAELYPTVLQDGVTTFTLNGTVYTRFNKLRVECRQTRPISPCENFEPLEIVLEDKDFSIELNLADKTFRPNTGSWLNLEFSCSGRSICVKWVENVRINFKSEVVLAPLEFNVDLSQNRHSVSMNLTWVPNTITVNDGYVLTLKNGKTGYFYTEYVNGNKRETTWDRTVFGKEYPTSGTYMASISAIAKSGEAQYSSQKKSHEVFIEPRPININVLACLIGLFLGLLAGVILIMVNKGRIINLLEKRRILPENPFLTPRVAEDTNLTPETVISQKE